MRRIRIAWLVSLLLLTVLWLWADPLLTDASGFAAWRKALVNYTGVVAIAVMSLALMLATRPVALEPALGGLDKMYRLHKWLGVTGLAMAVAHWLWTQAPKWLTGLGLLERQVRQRGPAPGGAGGVPGFLHLALVVHSVVLMPTDYWSHPLGPLMALLMAGGSVAAVALLLRRAGRRRRVLGLVEGVTYHPDMKVLEVAVRLEGRWPGHAAGQFAFVRLGGDTEPHPFTLSSAWQGDGRLLLLIKELGDYTAALVGRLQVGDRVQLEGPYGQFTFEGGAATPQLWVAGGIGIAPFVARMKHLALHPGGGSVELFHTTAGLDESATANLQRDAETAGVKLHLRIDARDGLLTGESLRAAVPDWASRDVWFCGPADFGKALRLDLCAHGLRARAFHQELYDLR